MDRRQCLKDLLAGIGAAAVLPAFASAPAPMSGGATAAQLAALERARGGRLGVAILDTGNGNLVAHRADEPFLMCSTFKLLLAATVLARVDRGEEKLDRRIVFGKDAVLDYAPVTKQHVGTPGLTVAQLCAAAITLSDNTAANLLIASLGGPAAVTRYARALGDMHTVLDRVEPALNARDTTTPRAMLGDMQKLLLGDALSQPSRRQLIDWMLACRTGTESLRAGLPAGWRVGDKTGQWDGDGVGASNDVAIVWPPGRQPLLVTAYCMSRTADAAARKRVLADVGRIVAAR